MSMKIVPIYVENSKLLGNCQINTRGVTYIEKNKELVFVPWFNEKGRLSSIRVLKEAEFKSNPAAFQTAELGTVFDKGFTAKKEETHA